MKTATIHMLPIRTMTPCRRCNGLRKVTFDQMSEAQQRWAPLGAIHPCPDCGDRTGATPPVIVAYRPEAK